MRQQLNLKSERGFTTVMVMMVILLGGLLIAAAFAASDGDTTVTPQGPVLEAGVRGGRGRRELVPVASGPEHQLLGQLLHVAGAGAGHRVQHRHQHADPGLQRRRGPLRDRAAEGAGLRRRVLGDRHELGDRPGRPASSASARPAPTAASGAASSARSSAPASSTTSGSRTSRRPTRRRLGPALPSKVRRCTTATAATPRTAGTSQFITGDGVNGPTHTNDEFLMLRHARRSAVTTTATSTRSRPATRTAGAHPAAGTTPTFNGVTSWGAPNLQLPTSNAAIKSYANANWIFTGPGAHQPVGEQRDRQERRRHDAPHGHARPNGVIYVQNGTCSTSFSASQRYPSGGGCGDAWVWSSTTGRRRT